MNREQKHYAWCLRCLLAACFLLVAGCGSDSDDSSPPDQNIQTFEVISPTLEVGPIQVEPNTFEVIRSTPEVDAIQVEPNTVVSIEFSSEISAATVTNSTIFLTGPAGVVDCDQAVSGATVNLTPKQDLALVSVYTIEISEKVEDLAGNSLAAPYQKSFSTRDGTWSAPGALGVVGSFPELAINDQGAATLAWNGPGGMYVSELDTSNNLWVSPLNLGSGDLQDVAIDELGTVWVAWSTHENGVANAYISRKTANGPWETEYQLFNSVGGTVRAKFKLAAGNPFVVIEEGFETSAALYWTSFSHGSWTIPELITSTDNPWISDLAVNSAGQAALVWLQGPNYILYGACFDPQSGWSTPVAISGSRSSTAAVSINNHGEAVAAWFQDFGYYACFHRSSEGWESMAQVISFDETLPIKMSLPDVDINDNGEAWLIGAGVNIFSLEGNVVAAQYQPEIGWQDQVEIGSGLVELLSWPKIYVDLGGNVLAYWERQIAPAQFSPYFNRLQKQTGWLGQQPISSSSVGSLGVLVGSDNGKAVAAWNQDTSLTASIFY